MKVYSWKTLIVTILIAGGFLVYEIRNLLLEDKRDFIPIFFWAYLFIKGLWVSFSSEGFQSDIRNETIGIKVRRKLFRPWAPIVLSGGYVLIIFAAIVAKFFPSLSWLSITLYYGGLIYMIILGLYMRKHVKEERKKYF